MRGRWVLTIAGYAGVAVAAWLVFTVFWLWRNQERVVFQPPAIVPQDPAAARRVEFRAADGHLTFGYLVASPTNARAATVVVAFHGNADLAAWLVPWAQELARRAGVAVLIPEYRGYGGVEGSPSYANAGSDALGALAYARTLNPERLVFFGHSLGTAIATELAASATVRPQAPASLVLQSPFTSARDMAARMLVPAVPWIWRHITRVRYDTQQQVRTLDVDVWVAHGKNDLTVPARMGRDVFESSRRKGEFLLVPGAGHNDVPEVGGERYWRWLVAAVTGVSELAPVGELEQQRGGRLP